ncbi:MAG: type II secretion system F family protein [Phycisphaeraceae bacterium]|nr:type II secretion system F family protein [Phycisphaeraceae bacterium]
MPQYRYQSRNNEGQMQGGILVAENAMAAAQTLRNRGLRVVNLSVTDTKTRTLAETLKALNYQSGPTQRDVLNFTSQLAVMIRAGISLRAAIEGIAEQQENLKFRNILMQIKQDVEAGKSFSESLAKHPKQFNPLYVNMVRASEVSGSFSRMLDRIAAYLTQWIETRAMVIGAMIYPGVIMGLAVSVTVFLLTFVLPKFAAVFEGKESAMPWPTIFLMNLSAFMIEWYWAIALGALFGGLGLFLFLRTDVGAWWFDGVKLKFPIFKKMFRALYIGRGLQTMGELVNAGVPMLDTIQITGDISGNRHYRRMWKRVFASVKEGKKIATPLLRTSLFPNSVTQMVAAGEESGKLGEVLDEVSTFYAKQLRETIKTVTSMIEPIMIIIMGSVVGFIAMAIILPIFKLSTLVQ